LTLIEIAQAVQALGVVFLLIGALFGLYKRWWVPGWTFHAMEADRDFWRSLYLRTYQTADKAITIAAKEADGAG